ncbi:lipopolysaccharide export system protein LptA [Alkalispirochaeta americana]|uniref:Lipopolysaccharide export system protein LptA n=1 Tax=Alkalispirochaeta americana TaxID=159291 RepID=A0A1N6U2J5_9SPIO|nr:hypothetical protein [Alkalispirochaeta americana]SIQ59721.1 lipopolysaccharide export system protein LptA [Alkalispirochaeta americana]
MRTFWWGRAWELLKGRPLGVFAGFLLLVLPPCLAGADSFRFSGDETEIILAEGRERTVLRGNARVESAAVILLADEIELYGPDFRYAETRKNVRVLDGERGFSITADTVWFDRETENFRASGQVVVDDEINDLIVKGGFLETRRGGDLLILQMSVRVLREDLTARSQFLRYRRQEEVLELSGFPRVFWKGDEYRATRIIMNLATDEIELQGQVEGSVFLEETAPREEVE